MTYPLPRGAAGTVLVNKGDASRPAADAALIMLRPQRDVPAAVICTAPFIPSASTMARICHLPEYPFAVIGHPIGSLPGEELRPRAELALAQVVPILAQAENDSPLAR